MKSVRLSQNFKSKLTVIFHILHCQDIRLINGYRSIKWISESKENYLKIGSKYVQ